MRRARIKALAAVPIRKKPLQDSVDSVDANDVAAKEKKEENISNINESEHEAIKDIAKIKEQKEENVATTNIATTDIATINVATTNVFVQKEREKDISSHTVLKEEKQRKENILDTNVSDVEDVAKVQKEPIKKEQNKVSLKESVVVEKQEQVSRELHCPLKPDFQELCAQTKSNAQESPCTRDKPDKVTDQSSEKNILLPDVPVAIDLASPTKVIQNRPCFMRPTPRLDSGGRIRKNSIQGSGASASESEDEHSKRVQSVVPSRVRNDSICSVQSNKESTINDNQNSPPKFKTTQKRRILVSESARKLAEARREFMLKHDNKTPDRSKLKMYDLIYYNPVTNPMKKLSVEQRQVPTPQPTAEILEEEEEDDPSAVPTPQVKVGPDGQLIIDEQSLVIEQTDARKEGEKLASEATIEDDNSHSGGFYKKHKRSKEWPKWETFKFYRVLNVVGTDFLLMKTLFPDRSRQEIKQKYKKEERVNRQLVEKALKYHQEFDTDTLEEELAMLQNLENIQNTSKITEKVKNGQYLSRTDRKRKRRLVAESVGECEMLSNDQEAEDTVMSTINDDEIDTEINSDTNNIQQQVEKRTRARKSKKRLDEKSEKFDDYSSCTDADSDSSEEVYQPRPTRSGRLSKKMRKLQAPDFSTPNSNTGNELPIDDKSTIPLHVAVEVTEYVNTPVTSSENTETSCSDNIMTMIPNIDQMEPGALVIVSKESTDNPGNTILQVYMVASNIDSTTTVTPSAASRNEPSDSLTNKPENTDSNTINIVDDSEK